EKGAAIQNSFSKPVATAIANYLFNEFSSSWDIIEFRSISPFDDFQSNLNLELQNKGAAFYQHEQFTNIVTDLSQFTEFEEFNKALSKNFKRKIVKSINKMNRAGEFTIQIINEHSKNIADLLDSYYKIYSKSWKTEEQDPTFHRRLGEYLHAKGMLRLFILCFRPDSTVNDGRTENAITSIGDSINPDNHCQEDSIPIASYFAIQQGKKTYGLKTAYDTEYSNFSPGSVLLYFLTKYLINEEKSASLNHQKGTEQFKYHIGGKVFAEYLCCFAANKHSFPGTIEVLIDKHLLPIYRNWSKSQLFKKMQVNMVQRRNKPSTG
ncbi:MAG: GNAT family N-acetyltransferase, partial [Candidatus Thiodiazotropha sp.]